MKRKVKVLFAILFVAIVSISTFVLADVGNINRYSSGGSSSSSSSSGISVSSGGGSIWGWLIGIVILIVIVYVVGKSKGKINNIQDLTDLNKVKDVLNDLQGMADGVKTDTKGIAEKIRETDPEFSEEKFLSWTRDVFVKIQAAWTARDWKVIRPFESNELFEQHNAQLQEYINNNKINVIERVAVQSAELMSYRVDGDKEIIEVYLKAVMKDYIIDATTKNVIEGNKNTDWNMKYKLTFARKNGVKTHAGTSNKSTTNCPNCGAPTEITSAGQCEYCGSVITTGEHDWVLTGLEGLK